MNETITRWVNRDTGHGERKAGRYWATDIYKIRKGYLNPHNFFAKKEIKDDLALELITRGIAMEDLLLRVMTDMKADVKHHQKVELKVNDEIVISGEMDFLFPDKVIECKYPRERCYTLPDKYIDQMTFYHVVTGLPTYLCEFPYPIKMRRLEFDKSRWEENIELLKRFHEKLKKI